MRYRKPFTPHQRSNALRVLASYRSQFGVLRHQFRPLTIQQRLVARQFRAAIHTFAEALKPADATLDVRRLNAAKDRADWLGMLYSQLPNR